MPVFVSTQFKVSKQNSILIHSSGVFTIFPIHPPPPQKKKRIKKKKKKRNIGNGQGISNKSLSYHGMSCNEVAGATISH